MVHSKDVPSPYPILSPCRGKLLTVPFYLKSCTCNVWHLISYDYMCMQNNILIAHKIAVTADVRQPWTNYVNENEYLIIGAIVHSEYSNI